MLSWVRYEISFIASRSDCPVHLDGDGIRPYTLFECLLLFSLFSGSSLESPALPPPPPPPSPFLNTYENEIIISFSWDTSI